ncbi:MAG: amidohydrolase family protein [Bacillota bacterium]
MGILIKNGIVVTMRQNNNLILDGAVYIEGNKIIDVGESNEIESKYRNKKLDKTINARNKAIFPGFINLHTHSVLSILRGQAEDEPSYKSVYEKMFPITDIMTEEDIYHMAKLGYLELLKFGSTTIVDHFGSKGEYLAKAALEMGIRAYLNDTILDVDQKKMKDKVYEYNASIGERTLNSSVDFIKKWHMAKDGLIRAILVPHAPDTCSFQLLKDIANIAKKYNLSITLHLAQNITEVEQVKKKVQSNSRRILGKYWYF